MKDILKYMEDIMRNNMCMHCLEEGDWEDEDKCPACESTGHISPWQVSKCPACNKEYFDKMDKLVKKVTGKSNHIHCPKCNHEFLRP